MFGRRHDYKGAKISPMQLIILILLRDRPMYGYEVLKELRDRFDGMWTPKTGSIYPSLKRLEEHGLITSEKRDETDYYHISSEGIAWVNGEIQKSPRDVRLLTKYLEIIGKFAAEVNPETSAPREGPFESMFEDDDSDLAKRAKRLRMAREKIAAHLAQIDLELKELEGDGSGEGGSSK